MRVRIAIGAAGVLLGLFGVFRLLTEINGSDLVMLGIWLAGAVILHDGVLSPIVAGLGVALERVPARARAFVQAALVAGGLVTAIALPLIHRENSQPASKAILTRNYVASLVVVLGIIAAVAVAGYVIKRGHDHRNPAAARPPRPRPGPGQRPSTANSRPPDVQSSVTE